MNFETTKFIFGIREGYFGQYVQVSGDFFFIFFIIIIIFIILLIYYIYLDIYFSMLI